MIVPIAVMQLTIWMTQSLLVGLDLQLSMVSSMLSAIITVVGVATVMHIVIQFREERGRGLDADRGLSRRRHRPRGAHPVGLSHRHGWPAARFCSRASGRCKTSA